MSRLTAEQAGGANVNAFLDMIAWSEIGPKQLAASDDGYNVLVGGTLFDSYADHPRKLIDVRPGLKSTAAGRYQLLGRYWNTYRDMLNLADYSPESQDRVAIQQIKECRALPFVQAGQFEQAVQKVRNIWASLPGAGYGQHEQKLPDLIAAYRAAGGVLA